PAVRAISPTPFACWPLTRRSEKQWGLPDVSGCKLCFLSRKALQHSRRSTLGSPLLGRGRNQPSDLARAAAHVGQPWLDRGGPAVRVRRHEGVGSSVQIKRRH